MRRAARIGGNNAAFIASRESPAGQEELRSRQNGSRPEFPAARPAVKAVEKGLAATKESVVYTVETAVGLLGLPVTSPSGTRLYGGHSLRVAGAVHLSQYLEILLIQVLGRWGSTTVLRYVLEAPLQRVTATYLRERHRRSVRFDIAPNLVPAQPLGSFSRVHPSRPLGHLSPVVL